MLWSINFKFSGSRLSLIIFLMESSIEWNYGMELWIMELKEKILPYGWWARVGSQVSVVDGADAVGHVLDTGTDSLTSGFHRVSQRIGTDTEVENAGRRKNMAIFVADDTKVMRVNAEALQLGSHLVTKECASLNFETLDFFFNFIPHG